MTLQAHALAPVLWIVLWTACAPAPAPASPAAAPEPSRAERRALHARGMAAYHQNDFAACAALFEQAHDRYAAACCHARAGARDAAFAALARAIDDGLSESEQANLEKDADLAPLRDDPRWRRELARQAARTAA